MKKVDASKTNAGQKKTRVAIYARVSTGLTEQMTSYDNQIETYTEQVMANPKWELVNVYADPALTGTTDERPEFRKMMADAEKHRFDLVLCKSISRFARNTLLTVQSIRHLKKIGVTVYFEKENIDTGSAYAEMMLTIMAAFAQEESRNTSERVKKGIHLMRLNGCVSWTPIYGYKREGEQEYIIDDKKAAIVRRIFDESEKGKTGPAIVKELNDEGIPSPNDSKWDKNTICNILKNEKYAGDVLAGKYYVEDHLTHKLARNNGDVDQVLIENHHTPIVDREQFDRVRLVKDMKCRNTYPFEGRLTCPHCGRNLEFEANALGYGKSAWGCNADMFYILVKTIQAPILEAYRQLDAANVKDALTREIKEANPEFDTVEYWWLDDLADKVTFGKHEGEDDQTLTVHWNCGKETTVPSGNGPMKAHAHRRRVVERKRMAKKTEPVRVATPKVTEIKGTEYISHTESVQAAVAE